MPEIKDLEFKIGELQAKLRESEAEAHYLRSQLENHKGGDGVEIRLETIGACQPSHTRCCFCRETFTELTPGIRTIHITQGYVSLCEVCYANAGNDVR